MAMTIHVDIVSAEKEIFSGTAEMVYAPAEMGEVGIAPRHTPFVSRLKPGEVRVEVKAGQQEYYYVSGGLIEVQPHVVTVLADTCTRAADLDEAAARECIERTEKELADHKADFDAARARAELAESMAQLRAIERLRKSSKKSSS